MVEPLTLPAAHDAALATLTHAFVRDPMYLALIPDEKARAPWVAFLLAGLVRGAGPDALFVGVDGGRRGALYATPSSHASRVTPLLGLVSPLLTLPLEKLHWRRALGVARTVEKLLPPKPYWHLHLIAVSDDARGHGVGGALLRHVIDVAQRARTTLHLETTNPDNLPFYERHGFFRVDEVRCFPDAPPLWTMRRAP